MHETIDGIDVEYRVIAQQPQVSTLNIHEFNLCTSDYHLKM